MIKNTAFGKQLRLGNYLYLYCTLMTIAKKSGHSIEFPLYFLWNYLENPPNIQENDVDDVKFSFKGLPLNLKIEDKEEIIQWFKDNKDKTINFEPYPNFQNELWWKDEEEYVKSILKFNEGEVLKVKEKYKEVFEKEVIGISIRRGDFVKHPSFYQIPEIWYSNALYNNFERHKYNVLIFSDDIEWCKNYFKHRDFHFAEANETHKRATYQNNPMEQLILGSLCNHAVIGNSTFSFWIGYYIDKFNNGRVIHCGKNLIGKAKEIYGDDNYYCKNWIEYK